MALKRETFLHWRVLARDCAQLGTGNALLYNLGRALSLVTRGWARIVKYRIVAQPTQTSATTQTPRNRGNVRRVSSDDAVVAAFPRSPEVVRSRFERGNACYVIDVKGQFAGHLWLAGDGFEEDEVRCRYVFAMPAQSVWDYDVFVAPEYRLSRVFLNLWNAVNEDIAQRGVLWSCSRISAFNFSSLAAHRRLGATDIASATFVCFGSAQLMFANVRPFLHFSIGDASPRLRLPAPIAADR